MAVSAIQKALYDTDKWGYNVIHVAAEKPEANDLLEALLTDYPIFAKKNCLLMKKMKKSSYKWTRSLPIARNKLGYRPLDIARLHANQASGLTMILELRRRHVIKLRKLLKVCKQKQASLKTRLQLDSTRSADNKSQAVVDLKKRSVFGNEGKYRMKKKFNILKSQLKIRALSLHCRFGNF